MRENRTENRITSRQNPSVRRAAALLRDGQERRAQGRFLCEGARLCRDAVLSGIEIEICFYTEQAEKRYGEYLAPIFEVCGERYMVEEHVAELLSSTKASQGVYCVCKIPPRLGQPFSETDFTQPNLLVLENLQDPGNLGTVLRTAEALGVEEIFLAGQCADVLSPKVLRASMGAVFRGKLFLEANAEKLCKLLKEQGYLLHAAVPDRTAREITAVDFTKDRHAVLIGNEGNGLTEQTLALCHDRVTIPMEGRAESLNASAAATILLWEMMRRSSSCDKLPKVSLRETFERKRGERHG